jgi:uncharacterized membrane protein YdbT with pleckstrin-like domain
VLCRAKICLLAYLYAVLIFALAMTPGAFTRLATTELALTTKRVIGKKGLFRRKTIDINLANIQVAHVRQGLLGKLFNYGAITIGGKDGSRMVFHGIVEPVDFQIQLQEAVEMAVLGHKLSQATMEKW